MSMGEILGLLYRAVAALPNSIRKICIEMEIPTASDNQPVIVEHCCAVVVGTCLGVVISR